MPRRISVSLPAIACILIAGLAAQTPPTRQIALPDSHQFSPMSWQPMAMSPDGTRFVYVANARLYSQAVAGGQPTEILGTAIAQGVAMPVFSPDGRSLAFWSVADQTLRRIAVGGGTPTVICQADNPTGMSWGPDDRIVFGQGPKGIMRVAANGGMSETIVASKNGEFLFGPRMLPGSDVLLFTSVDPPTQGGPVPGRGQIVVQSLASSERKLIVEAFGEGRYAPTGHIVYTVNGALLAVPFDVKRLETSGQPVTMIQEVRNGFTPVTGQFSFSDSGSLVYVPGRRGQNQVVLVDRAGRRRPIGFLPDTVFAPRLSPNGRQLAVDAEGSIWVADLASGSSSLSPLRRVVTGGPTTGVNQFPLWSGDGERVIFTSTRDGGVQALYWQRADGTGDAELLVKPARSPEAWLPQSQRLSYITLKGDTDYDVWTYSLRDKTTAPLLETPMTAQLSSKFSHDGRWVAYQGNDTGRFEIYVQPVPPTGAQIQITKDGGRQPMWSVDDRELFYTNDNRLYSVAIQSQPTRGTVTAGTPVALPIADFITIGSLYTRRQYDITPDGKQFLMMFRVPTQVSVITNWFDDLKRRVPAR
jgi:Tol biopolymer transport system component